MWPLSSRGGGGDLVAGPKKKGLFCGFPKNIQFIISGLDRERKGQRERERVCLCETKIMLIKNIDIDYGPLF